MAVKSASKFNGGGSTPSSGSASPRKAGRVSQINQEIESKEAHCEPKPEGFFCNAHQWFRIAAARTASAMGSPWTFAIAVGSVITWALLGPHFQYSENWQLVINTGTTIVTFLMIFLVQNTQNRDSRAIHLKLDELLHGVKGARTSLVDLEDATDEELEALHQHFKSMRSKKSDADVTDEPGEVDE